MPVRSSICTYSPASSSKHSSISSLSIGHYKPLSSTTTSYTPSSTSSALSSKYGPPPPRTSTLLYNPSTCSSAYTPTSVSVSTSTTSRYRPLSSSNSPSRYSTSSSTSSSGISSISSSNDYYNNYNSHTTSSSPATMRRLSYTSHQSLLSDGNMSTSSLLLHNNNTSRQSSGSGMLVHSPPCRPSSLLYSPSPASSIGSSAGSLSSSSHYYGSRNYGSAPTSSSASTTHEESQQFPSQVPRGLTNLGNTCYMNSVIQALYSIKPFQQLIESSYSSKPLTSNLRDLFKSMKQQQQTRRAYSDFSSSSGSAASAASFKQTFSRYQNKFSGFNQQDAQEFLRYLINGCHDEMNQVRPGQYRSSSKREPPKTASEAWSQYRDIVDNSPLVDMLVGQLCSTITCSVCQNKSHCWDPFWDLSLALSSASSRSYNYQCHLIDLVSHFTASETLDGDEKPICERCKKANRSSKQINFTRLPRVLILHLKKFSNDGYKLSSPEVKCEPEFELEYGANLGSKQNYFLVSAISHHGHSAASGHYTAHCKYSNRWFHFNDDRVKDVTDSFDSSKLNDAYVLVYTQDSSYANTNNNGTRKLSTSTTTTNGSITAKL